MAGKVFNCGIVGYGLSTKVFQIPFIDMAKNLKVHAIVQRHPTAENNAPRDHPDVKHYTSVEALLQDAELDVVVLSTPPNTHFDLAGQSLRAGKHVLVEKPFVPTSAQAEELVALARAQGRMVCVYQNRRWDADFLTVRKLIAESTLGRVLEFETHFDRYRPQAPTSWKGTLTMAEGGGVLYDLGTHILDQVYTLFGMPGSVTAKFVDQREGRIVSGESAADEPDSITAILSYPSSGVLVHARMAVMSAEARQVRFWLRGSKGSYLKFGLDPQENQLRTGWKGSELGFGVDDASMNGRVALVQPDGSVVEKPYPNVPPVTYVKLFEAFGKALESGKEEDVPVPAAQAAQVLKIIEGIKESAKTGKDFTF